MTTEENGTAPARPTEPIRFGNLLISFTTEFHRIWDSRGSDASAVSFWRPAPAPDALPGYFPLGDLAIPGYDNVNGNQIVAVVREAEPQPEDSSRDRALSPPEDYERVWKDSDSGAAADCTVWRPLPPTGYVALGLVCSNGRDKPLLNAIRCVRADLLIAADVSDLIWNDKGSGARQNFSAWRIDPPRAAAGEICFSPGTFFGTQSHNRPAAPVAYALRMQIPRQVSQPPAPPELAGHAPPEAAETANTTQSISLPWFTVTDHLAPSEQLRSTPFYRLERTDRYVLVGHGHNTRDKARSFKWQVTRAQNAQMLQVFNRLTSIEVDAPWPLDAPSGAQALKFSANLPKDFVHTETSAQGWSSTGPLDVIAMAGKNRSVAVYQAQSHYTLLRADGTPVAISIGYTDDENLHLTEYPPQEEAPVSVAAVPLPESKADTSAEPQPLAELPIATDSAP
ncbi:Vps62-related protein [Pseudomonas sp. B2M1-30]|uniref:Vps62-related protein n=1 Tax=Pseudomonas TaxID=286 RepID=UPI0021C98D5A|nr:MULTISPECIES: Vps62-related protein [Pseudomonas]MCU0118294.1 Vps62-related protein [Pseudomonas sp. B2M1-30]MCU7259668.1 Vps62-related protein [Pseudomonas koreensis]